MIARQSSSHRSPLKFYMRRNCAMRKTVSNRQRPADRHNALTVHGPTAPDCNRWAAHPFDHRQSFRAFLPQCLIASMPFRSVPSCDTTRKTVLAKRTHWKLVRQKRKCECVLEKALVPNEPDRKLCNYLYHKNLRKIARLETNPIQSRLCTFRFQDCPGLLGLSTRRIVSSRRVGTWTCKWRRGQGSRSPMSSAARSCENTR